MTTTDAPPTETGHLARKPHRHHGHRPHSQGSPTPQVTDDAARRPWTVLAIALAAQILVVLDISVVNTALPTIGRSLHLRGGDLSWLVTAYLLMSGGGLLLGGRIADVFSRRRVFLTGLAVFTIASAGSALAASAEVLITARAGQGLGAALMTPAALSLITTTYSGAQRTRGLTLWGMVGSLGIAAGVLFGGALTTWASWQMIFWINVPIGAIAFCAAAIKLPEQPTTHPGLAQLDLLGGAVVVLGLGTLIFGIESVTSHGWTAPRTIAAFAAATVLLGAFSTLERRAKNPLVPPHTWRLRSLVAGTGTMAGITAILVGVIFLISIFCQTVLGYSAVRTGLALLPLAAAITASAHVAGHLLQHLSARTVAASGLVAAAAGAFLLQRATVHPGSYPTTLLPAMVVLGLGAGVVFIAVSISAMAEVPASHAGMASGLLMTGHEIGAALGVAVLGAAAASAGTLATAAGAAVGTGRGFAVAGILALIVAGVSALTLPTTKATAGAPIHMH
jgi:EmrB/QacA subfamily drug resistance transporter